MEHRQASQDALRAGSAGPIKKPHGQSYTLDWMGSLRYMPGSAAAPAQGWMCSTNLLSHWRYGTAGTPGLLPTHWILPRHLTRRRYRRAARLSGSRYGRMELLVDGTRSRPASFGLDCYATFWGAGRCMGAGVGGVGRANLCAVGPAFARAETSCSATGSHANANCWTVNGQA